MRPRKPLALPPSSVCTQEETVRAAGVRPIKGKRSGKWHTESAALVGSRYHEASKAKCFFHAHRRVAQGSSLPVWCIIYQNQPVFGEESHSLRRMSKMPTVQPRRLDTSLVGRSKNMTQSHYWKDGVPPWRQAITDDEIDRFSPDLEGMCETKFNTIIERSNELLTKGMPRTQAINHAVCEALGRSARIKYGE